MIGVSVYDLSKPRRDALRELLIKYSIQFGKDLDILWLLENVDKDAAKMAAPRSQLALISLDTALGKSVGDALSVLNPECRIIYYSPRSTGLEELLSSRPRAFKICTDKIEMLESKVREVIEEIETYSEVLRYETKRTAYVFPYREILYFRSNLKFVEVHIFGKSYEQVFAKLSDIEPLLGSSFLRIHKSYIVNTMYIEKIDKKEHLVYIEGGECLPISEVQYKNVIRSVTADIRR